MALVKLDAEKLQNSVGVLKTTVNTEMLEDMIKVASTLQNTGDTNKQVEQQLENCKKFQAQYITTLKGVNDYIGELGKVYDIAEFMDKKANVGDVSSRDTGFNTNKVDNSKFRM